MLLLMGWPGCQQWNHGEQVVIIAAFPVCAQEWMPSLKYILSLFCLMLPFPYIIPVPLSAHVPAQLLYFSCNSRTVIASYTSILTSVPETATCSLKVAQEEPGQLLFRHICYYVFIFCHKDDKNRGVHPLLRF